nr:hypothetical protein [Nostoc sp. SerVER01]
CAFARQSLQRGATALDGFPGLKQVAWEPPQRAALPLREIKNHLCKRSFLREWWIETRHFLILTCEFFFNGDGTSRPN